MSKFSYTYTVLRYVHDSTTTEYINIGVVLVSLDRPYAHAIIQELPGARVLRTFPSASKSNYRHVTKSLQKYFDQVNERISSDLKGVESLPKNALELAHSIIPQDDSSMQWSPMGSGLSLDPEATLQEVYERMVMRYESSPERKRITDEKVWSKFEEYLSKSGFKARLEPHIVNTDLDSIQFDHAYKNGRWNCLDPISLDYRLEHQFKERAYSKVGRGTTIQSLKNEIKIFYLVGRNENRENDKFYEQAIDILRQTAVPHEIVEEENAHELEGMLTSCH